MSGLMMMKVNQTGGFMFDVIFNALHRLDNEFGSYEFTHSREHRSRVFDGLLTGYNESYSGAIIYWINNPFGNSFHRWDA